MEVGIAHKVFLVGLGIIIGFIIFSANRGQNQPEMESGTVPENRGPYHGSDLSCSLS